MTERSIAEIIGWERRGESPTGIPRYEHRDAAGRRLIDYRFGGDDGITVDDMLAWLRTRLADRDQVFINCHIADATDEPFLVRVIPATHDDPMTNHRGRTLHGAVERCVRAVAEAT